MHSELVEEIALRLSKDLDKTKGRKSIHVMSRDLKALTDYILEGKQ